MIYPKVNAKEWAEQYHLLTDSQDCPNCGVSCEFNIPFAISGYRGLEAEECRGCGRKTGMSILTPYGEEKLAFWNKVKDWTGIK